MGTSSRLVMAIVWVAVIVFTGAINRSVTETLNYKYKDRPIEQIIGAFSYCSHLLHQSIVNANTFETHLRQQAIPMNQPTY